MHHPGKMLVAFIRALPPWAEFAIVVALAFGHFAALSLFDAFAIPRTAILPAISFAQLPIYEITIAAVLSWVLAVRGWRFADLGIDRPNVSDLGQAALLLAAVYALTFTLFYFTPTATYELSTDVSQGAGATNIPFVLIFSIVNATFEEVFVCAYVLSAWRGSDMWIAITASAAIRLTYHLYQGPLAVISIGPLGLVFAWYYATQGRLWPLIAAHAVLDVLYLLS
jgi:membrane protease YdiL (CAAX protease family)